MASLRLHCCHLVRIAAWLALAAFATPAKAHPGVGIVRDSRGNIYYTDLKQVWRIAPDGKRAVVVPFVHTHELCLDSQDNLYGEHLWYEGERTDKWGHYVWRMSPDGLVEKIIGPREGFLKDYSFIRDAAGNMYWADRPTSAGAPTRVRKRAPDGRITEIAAAIFNNVRWMTVTGEGTMYLVDFRGGWSNHLIRVTLDGKVTTVTTELSESRFSIFGISDQHAVMGLATDKNGNVYAAVAGNRVVKKVNPNGEVSVVLRSDAGWYPTGVLPCPGGEMWVLEGSVANTVRARRVRVDGSSQVF